MERHPGLALGDLAADPGGGVDGAAAADDDPLAVGDSQAVGVLIVYPESVKFMVFYNQLA